MAMFIRIDKRAIGHMVQNDVLKHHKALWANVTEIWLYSIWYDIIIWHYTMQYIMIWVDMIWYDMIRYDMICDMIWYDMIWYKNLYLNGRKLESYCYVMWDMYQR